MELEDGCALSHSISSPEQKSGMARKLILALSLLTLFHGAAAQAEDTSQVESVQVTGVRDAGLVPYAELDKLRNKLVAAAGPHDKVRIMLRLVGMESGLPVPGTRVSLWTEDAVYPMPLKNGFIALDDVPRTDDATAQFSSNKKKGSLSVELYLFAVLPDAQQFSAGDALAAMRQANQIRDEVVPWYFRVFAPRFERLEACGATAPIYTLDGQAWAMPPSREPGCVSITRAELEAHPQAVFAANGAVNSYRLRGAKDD